MRKVSNVAIFIWIFFILQADLKVVIYPYIDWIMTTILIIPFLYSIKEKKVKISIHSVILIYIPLLFLIVGFLLSIYNSNDQIVNIAELIKLGIIFTFIFFTLSGNSESLNIYKNAIIASVIINFAMIILGTTFIHTLAWQAGRLRYATIFNMPGSLYKSGLFIAFYFLYNLYNEFNAKNLLFFLCSMAIILFDGSRTALVGLGVILLYFVYMVLFLENRIKISKIKKVFLIPGAAIFITVVIKVLATFKIIPGLSRLEEFTNLLTSMGLIKGILASDESRYQMLISATDRIKDNPFIGKGFESTRVYGVVIHNSYFQIWADIGILSFIGLIMLYFVWIFRLGKVQGIISKCENYKVRGFYYNSICSLLLITVLALFHPFSVEPSEWIFYLLNIIIYMKLLENETVS